MSAFALDGSTSALKDLAAEAWNLPRARPAERLLAASLSLIAADDAAAQDLPPRSSHMAASTA